MCDVHFHLVGSVMLCKQSRGNAHNFLHDCVTTNAQGKHVFEILSQKKKFNEEKCHRQQRNSIPSKDFNVTLLSL